MAAHPGPTADTRSEQAELEMLAAQITALGYEAQLVTPPGRLPYLDVSNPRTALLTEKVYAQAGSFFWPWAESIAPCDQVAEAAAIVTRVLRTIDGD